MPGPFHQLRVVSESIGTTRGTSIELDGKKVDGVRFIRLTGALDDVWRCEIEFLPGALDVQLAGVAVETIPSDPPPDAEA